VVAWFLKDREKGGGGSAKEEKEVIGPKFRERSEKEGLAKSGDPRIQLGAHVRGLTGGEY